MLPHQPLHSAACDILAFPAQPVPDLAGAVSALALVMDTLDLLQVCRILPGSVRRQIRVPGEGRMPVGARWGDRQHTAGRLDPKLPLMLFNEGNHLPNRRSSSACAKYADAFLRIPLAWRSCLFPRSNAFSRARRSLVKPSPPSCRRAHRRLGPLLAKKPNSAFPQIRRVFRGISSCPQVHRAHPLRVLLSGKPAAVQDKFPRSRGKSPASVHQDSRKADRKGM